MQPMSDLKNENGTDNYRSSALSLVPICVVDGNQVEIDAVGSSEIDTIHHLHERIATATKNIVEDAIQIGELLTRAKKSMPHGHWELWVEKNLTFSGRTARCYMRLFKR